MSKPKELDIVGKDLETLHKWLAAEYRYFNEMREDLQDILQKLENIKQAKGEYRDARRDLSYASRSERRVNQTEQRLEKDLTKLKKILPQEYKDQIEDVQEKLVIAARQLIKQASLFRGYVKDHFNELGALIDVLKSEQKSDAPNLNKVRQLKTQITTSTNELITRVKISIEWIRSLSTSVVNMQKIEQKLEQLAT
jgi:DNA repair ATPase RecN